MTTAQTKETKNKVKKEQRKKSKALSIKKKTTETFLCIKKDCPNPVHPISIQSVRTFREVIVIGHSFNS